MLNRVSVYKFYRDRLLPFLESFRGATAINRKLQEFAHSQLEHYSGKPEGLDDFNWDNLLILDGARHDVYSKICAECNSRITKGSSSSEFIAENFSNSDYSDTVVITANPHYSEEIFRELTGRKPKEVFHAVYHTYSTDWSEEKGTVLPKPVIRDAKNAQNLFPNKRLLIHFMQPHYPFVTSELTENGIRPDLDEGKTGESAWEKAEKGVYSEKKVEDAYKRNLDYVYPKAKKLAENLSGTTIITSDHGNLIGEGNLFGHPRGSDAKFLREVPYEKLD